MGPVEEPLRCLAVRFQQDAKGEIDSTELENYLNRVIGPDQWLSTTQWLFIEPPSAEDEAATVPVVVQERIVGRAIQNDRPSLRILFDHRTSPSETRKWRWVAFQVAPNSEGQGRFPWEMAHA
ncbi:hypothetical protein [Brevundimonas diminuta]|uniref:hypothetical protein n=1 Tax=Brevundimonas diminuta TaxID=293 RepID=UPI0030F758F4